MTPDWEDGLSPNQCTVAALDELFVDVPLLNRWEVTDSSKAQSAIKTVGRNMTAEKREDCFRYCSPKEME